MPHLPLRALRGLVAAPVAALALGGVPETRAGAPSASQPPIGRIELPSPPQQAFGRIEGSVIISTALVARRPRFRIYSDPGPGAPPPSAARPDSSAEMRNVVVYIAPEGAGTPLAGRAAGAASAASAARRVAVSQHDETFEPHILPVVRGATVEFRNDDDIFHNVFSLSSARSFDLGRYPKGNSRSVTFDKSGRVDVFCHIHSDMSAIVLVLDNPFFATPDAAGRFVIDSLPPGDYTVVGWHQRIKPVRQRVRVAAGQATRTVFTIPLPAPDTP